MPLECCSLSTKWSRGTHHSGVAAVPRVSWGGRCTLVGSETQ